MVRTTKIGSAAGRRMMPALPPLVEAIMQRQELTAEAVFRDGPRYWVGRVTTLDRRKFVLKVVIDDTPWMSPLTGKGNYPSDQLRIEVIMSRELKILVATDDSGATWLLRQYNTGRDMAAGVSPFIFKEEFFTPATSEAVLDFIQGYQRLTPHFEQLHVLGRIGLTDTTHGPLAQPCAELEPYVPALRTFFEAHTELFDSHQTMLCHGQVYPPHIYIENGRASLIDWENTSFSIPQADYLALWVRAFAHPQWQAWLVDQLHSRGIITTAVDEQLWNIGLLVQSIGNLNYLAWSQAEDEVAKKQATAVLVKSIERILP